MVLNPINKATDLAKPLINLSKVTESPQFQT